jgi:L-fucose mutarotase/ribose pyranase (RbsD/FucU family)
MKTLPALLLTLACALAAVSHCAAETPWRTKLAEELPLLGHRNWIVIADSAYPWQTSAGIETIDTGADHIEVIKAVLATLDRTPHVRPILFTDAELPFVPESDAKGVTLFREILGQTLISQTVQAFPHEEIINKLDSAGRTFHVLLLKTKLAIPYSSVFIQLDCAYWSPDAEARLREAMKAAK